LPYSSSGYLSFKCYNINNQLYARTCSGSSDCTQCYQPSIINLQQCTPTYDFPMMQTQCQGTRFDTSQGGTWVVLEEFAGSCSSSPYRTTYFKTNNYCLVPGEFSPYTAYGCSEGGVPQILNCGTNSTCARSACTYTDLNTTCQYSTTNTYYRYSCVGGIFGTGTNTPAGSSNVVALIASFLVIAVALMI